MTQLTNGLLPQFKAHSKTIRSLIQDHSVSHLIVERYMSRRMGGVTIEAVNVMIGGLLEICSDTGVHFKCIPSSQWKNAANRAVDGFLESEYQHGKQEKVTPHTIDAVMIGLYAIGVMAGKDVYSTIGLETGKVVRASQKGKFLDIGTLIKKEKRKKRRTRGKP